MWPQEVVELAKFKQTNKTTVMDFWQENAKIKTFEVTVTMFKKIKENVDWKVGVFINDISVMLSCGRRKLNGLDFRRKKLCFVKSHTKTVNLREFSQRNKMPYHVASLFVLPCTRSVKFAQNILYLHSMLIANHYTIVGVMTWKFVHYLVNVYCISSSE